jgi:hypothetical protein
MLTGGDLWNQNRPALRMAARSAANDAMFLNNLYGGMDEPEIKIIDVAPVSEQARLDVLRFQRLEQEDVDQPPREAVAEGTVRSECRVGDRARLRGSRARAPGQRPRWKLSGGNPASASLGSRST